MSFVYDIVIVEDTAIVPSSDLDVGKTTDYKVPDGVPDESKWGLDWMLKLHPTEGQLYRQVADVRDHMESRLPFKDTPDYGRGQGELQGCVFCQ